MPASTEAFSPIGAKVEICSTLPAANPTSAMYDALTTWLLVGEIESIGEYGPESSTNTRTRLSDGLVKKTKGPRNYGALPLTLALAPGDVGQAGLIVAEASKNNYSVRLTHGDGSVDYFQGLIMSFKRNPGGAEQTVEMASTTIEINTSIVTKYPA